MARLLAEKGFSCLALSYFGVSSYISVPAAAAILIAACGLGACGNLPPGPVQKPIEVRDAYTVIPSVRLSWYPQGFATAPRSLNWGVELEYARGTGRSDQTLGSNEFISLAGTIFRVRKRSITTPTCATDTSASPARNASEEALPRSSSNGWQAWDSPSSTSCPKAR